MDALSGADLARDEPSRTGPRHADLVAAPARAQAGLRPHSLAAQLRWIRDHWAGWLDDADLLDRRPSAGLLDEDERAAWLRGPARSAPAGRPRPRRSAGFGGLDDEPEAFSPDHDWMPELVLMAKTTYVWLDQLSRTYGRAIRRLDEIPDEELDELRARGFTGLWLIGLWERSHASQRIKQLRGNPDAVASAYSLVDYRIADDLGGEAAWRGPARPGRGSAASASRATWCPTTWASTRAG